MLQSMYTVRVTQSRLLLESRFLSVIWGSFSISYKILQNAYSLKQSCAFWAKYADWEKQGKRTEKEAEIFG